MDDQDARRSGADAVADAGGPTVSAVAAHGPAGPALDDINRAIIEELQQDGRRPYAAIAEADPRLPPSASR